MLIDQGVVLPNFTLVYILLGNYGSNELILRTNGYTSKRSLVLMLNIEENSVSWIPEKFSTPLRWAIGDALIWNVPSA